MANIALFGGTFDPIHVGHLKAAQAALERFRLDRILFVPCGTPPHKYRDRLTPFVHRYSLVSLACAGNPRFVPSLLEAPTDHGRIRYSIDTVRQARKQLPRKTRLFFLIGVDAFLDIRSWKSHEELLKQVDFIVVSRPGFELNEIRQVLPLRLLRNAHAGEPDTLSLGKSTVHILSGVHEPIAASEIRQAIRRGAPWSGLVPEAVADYIRKEGLYLSPALHGPAGRHGARRSATRLR